MNPLLMERALAKIAIHLEMMGLEEPTDLPRTDSEKTSKHSMVSTNGHRRFHINTVIPWGEDRASLTSVLFYISYHRAHPLPIDKPINVPIAILVPDKEDDRAGALYFLMMSRVELESFAKI